MSEQWPETITYIKSFYRRLTVCRRECVHCGFLIKKTVLSKSSSASLAELPILAACLYHVIFIMKGTRVFFLSKQASLIFIAVNITIP